jgi:hypothetical protein
LTAPLAARCGTVVAVEKDPLLARGLAAVLGRRRVVRLARDLDFEPAAPASALSF